MDGKLTAAAGIQMVHCKDKFQTHCYCKKRRTGTSKELVAGTNDGDWKEDGERGEGRSIWGGTH